MSSQFRTQLMFWQASKRFYNYRTGQGKMSVIWSVFEVSSELFCLGHCLASSMSGHAQLNTLGIYLSIIQCTVRLSHVQSREGRGRYLGWVRRRRETVKNHRKNITNVQFESWEWRAGSRKTKKLPRIFFSSLLLTLRRADMNVTLVLVVSKKKVIVQRSWGWLKHKQSAELVNLLVLFKFKSIPGARASGARNLVKFCLIVISWGR